MKAGIFSTSQSSGSIFWIQRKERGAVFTGLVGAALRAENKGRKLPEEVMEESHYHLVSGLGQEEYLEQD